MILCFFLSNHYGFPKGLTENYKGRVGRILLNAIAPMVLFVIIMRGVGACVFTATKSSASAASDFVNGHILYGDGGILAYIGKQP